MAPRSTRRRSAQVVPSRAFAPARWASVMPFYVDVLGFRLSDYIDKPFRAYFFHVNPRHHSLALIETGKNGMHHLMMELFSLDDVGQSYDVALSQQERIGV